MLSEAFRPETFDQIIGHTEAKKQLTEYLTANPRGVAFLISGTAGIGKTTLALTAARALKDRGGERALATMCVGVGQGSALALARA